MTEDLLTRAADAAGAAAEALAAVRAGEPQGREVIECEFRLDGWPDDAARALAASGPDHWRAVEGTFRDAVHRAGLVAPRHAERLTSGLRPLAEQVLRDLGAA